jgi:hypothetical protein
MLRYLELKPRAGDFLAATGLTVDEFEQLLPAFAAAYRMCYPTDRTQTGQPRQRRQGGGAKGALSSPEDRLLFILVYQKTQPLQVMHALQFGLSQPQAHYWIHRLLPVLQQALADLGHRPERDGGRVVDHRFATEGGAALAIDGTERRRQRPTDDVQQRAHYSGKKKTHTDKNLLLVNEATGKVVYLSPTACGKTHDKKLADDAAIAYPLNATLDQDTGFQGYAPEDVLVRQPKKSRAGKN